MSASSTARPSRRISSCDVTAVDAPAVRVEPLGDVGAVGVLVGQLTHVERVVDAELGGDALEPLPHPLATIRGMNAHRLRRDAATRRRSAR